MKQRKQFSVKESVGSTTTYLLFLLGGMLYATPALSVSRIANWSKPVKLTDPSGKTTTLVNIDGTNVPLFRIHSFLGTTEPPEKVALKLQHTHGHIAVSVDEALELVEIPDSMVSQIDKLFSSEELWKAMNRCFTYKDAIVPILDMKNVKFYF